MKKIKENIPHLILFIVLFILAYHFPFTKDIWPFLETEPTGLSVYTCGSLLLSKWVSFIATNNIIKSIFIAFVLSSLSIIIENVVNNRNKTLSFLALFFYMIMGKVILETSTVSLLGLTCNIFIIDLLLIYLYVLKQKKRAITKQNMFILGMVLSIFTPLLTLILLTLSIITLISNWLNDMKDKKLNYLLVGQLMGSLLLRGCFLNNNISISKTISRDVLHTLIPVVLGTNLLIPSILFVYFVYIFIKIIKLGKIKQIIGCLISLLIVISYLIASLFSHNDIINYVILILYNMACLYLLLNANSSRLFKEKIKLYYLIKFLYLIMLMFVPLIHPGYAVFFVIFDILIILEIVNYTFPVNYLKNLWFISCLLICSAYIIYYRNIIDKVLSMDLYIKNHLECNITELTLPYKYKKRELEYYLPVTKEEKNSYLTYLKVDLNTDYEIKFLEE